jgi:hypothetical protein
MIGFDPKQQSQGLGDTVAKVTNFFGIDKVVDAVTKIAGMEECGCNERRQILNELFPYDEKVRKFQFKLNHSNNGVQYYKGQIVEVTRKHSLHNDVIMLTRENIIEEIL